MKTLQTKTQIREAVLKASVVNIRGNVYKATKNNAGFINEKKFLFRDTVFNLVRKNCMECELSENQLFIS